MERNVLFGKYEMGRVLGRGAFGKVYYARNIRTTQSVAIKVINKSKIIEKNMTSHIKKEITIMGRLRHPNVVRLYEVLACKEKIYFVMELAKGGDLCAKMAGRRFSEELSRKYFQQLISAVGYSHFRGVFHRDLKLDNILLDEHHSLKVADFGLGAIKDHIRLGESLNTFCGTPEFMAPEIIKRMRYKGAAVDVWSCGVILYVLTAGFLPFSDTNVMALYRKIYQGRYRCPRWMSPDLTRFLGRLLETDPTTRITIDEIIRDPWFRNGGLFRDKSPEFEFPFYHNYKPPAEQQQLLQLQQQQQVVGGELNAFDLIAFSPSLDLSGIFNQSYNPFEDIERFVSALPVDTIIATIKKVAEELNLKVQRENCVVDLVEPRGNFIARVEIHPLIEQLVSVKVMIKAEDSVYDNTIWKEKLMPKLSGLIYYTVLQPVEEMETTHDELIPAVSFD